MNNALERPITISKKPSDIVEYCKHRPWLYVLTLIFCVLIAVFLWFIGDKRPFIENLVIICSTGLTIHLLINSTLLFFHKASVFIQWLVLLLLLVAGTFIGIRLGFWLTGIDAKTPNDFMYMDILVLAPIGIFFGGIIIWFYYAQTQLYKAHTAMLELKLQSANKEQQLSQAQFNLLQAQIEPHFLFNTLANVHSLIEQNPKQASSMLERVNDYLRAALDHSRSHHCLLDHEIKLLRSYLDIMQIRMGKRLHFEIMMDEKLLKLPFPPMLLQPLVENALKHGLEPKIEGGNLQISAMIKDDKLCIDIIDSGVGLENFEGEGLGLSNIRERLNTLYGHTAQLEIIALAHRGVRASIQIPMDKP